MQSLRTALSAALFVAFLPCAGMAQKQRSAPAKLPPVEFMGYHLGMTKAQADSVTAAHGWKYTLTTDDISEVDAGDPDLEGGASPSLGVVFCEPGADVAGCPAIKSIDLTFTNAKVSEISVSSLLWTVDKCTNAWTWQKAMGAAFLAKYGKPKEEADASLKPEMLATLDEPKTTASWVLPKAKYGFTQAITISVFHSDPTCWSLLVISDMSEIYD